MIFQSSTGLEKLFFKLFLTKWRKLSTKQITGSTTASRNGTNDPTKNKNKCFLKTSEI